MLFSYFDVVLICFDYSLFDIDPFKTMTDNVGSNTNNIDSTINLNNTILKVSLSASSLNNLAAAASVAGGGGLALKAMPQIPGVPATKTAAGIATMLTAQALTVGMSKVLNYNNSNNENKKIY